MNLSLLYARVGSTAFDSGGQFVKVNSFTPHPNFNGNLLDYDFAVFLLSQDITLGSNVAIVPLTYVSNPVDESLVTVSGWGVTSVNRLHM